MGYTRYWERTKKPITERFIEKVNNILEDCRIKGITIRNGIGEDDPIVSMNRVVFNGNADRNLDYETFYITNSHDNIGFGFCKTARKPYDYAVRKVLKVAEEEGLVVNVSDDGENEEIINDDYEVIGSTK